PRLTEISHAKMNIDIRPRKLREISRKTHHSGGFGPDLHEAHFPHPAQRRPVVAAFHGRARLRGGPPPALLFRFFLAYAPLGVFFFWVPAVCNICPASTFGGPGCVSSSGGLAEGAVCVAGSDGYSAPAAGKALAEVRTAAHTIANAPLWVNIGTLCLSLAAISLTR